MPPHCRSRTSSCSPRSTSTIPGDTYFPAPQARGIRRGRARRSTCPPDGTRFAFVDYVRARLGSEQRSSSAHPAGAIRRGLPGSTRPDSTVASSSLFYAGQLAGRRAERDEVPAPSRAIRVLGRAGSGRLPFRRQGARTASSASARDLRGHVRHLGDRARLRAGRRRASRARRFLELMLGSVDPGIRYALDLRDPTWDGVEERLSEAGVARVDDRSGGAGWAYLRYRELSYSDAELTRSRAELLVLDGARHRGIRFLPPRRRAERAARGDGDRSATEFTLESG